MQNPRSPAVASFGAWMFLVADGLFWAALLVIYATVRRGTPNWPDLPAEAQAGAALPAAWVGCLFGVWFSYRFGRSMVPAFAGLVLFLALLGYFWRSSVLAGLTPMGTRYGMIVYLLTVLLATHAAGALVTVGVVLVRGRGRAPHLGRFLGFLTCVSAFLVGAVFWL